MANFFNFIAKLFSNKHERDVKGYWPVVEEINQHYERLGVLSNDELRSKTQEFKERIKNHLRGIQEDINTTTREAEETEDIKAKEEFFKSIDELKKEKDKHLEDILKELLPEAFAVMKETARRFKENKVLEVTATEHDRDLAARKNYILIDGNQAKYQNSWMAAGGQIVWDMVHYDVQLIGGMVLHDGKIAEMATGEGKTLVATLPAYLNALGEEGVHIVTVNDYLAKRDSEWIGPLFEFLMMTVDCIDKYQPHSPSRIKAYHSDVTYGTNSEFGFDFLRDNMVRSKEELVQRKAHYAMVDEVDSVLVDDARTPLIISGPVEEGEEEQEYNELKPKVEKLIEVQRRLSTEYLTEAKRLIKDGTGYEEGEAGMALLRAHRSLPKNRPLIKFLSEEGVKVTLQRAENFYMQEQERNMPKVDAPLYFVIDEKNRSVQLTEKGAEYLARGENDNGFFVLPDLGVEMHKIDQSDISASVKKETREKLILDYSIKSRRLHSVSQLLKAYTLFERDEEYVVIDGQVKIVDEQTGRMMEGRRYSDGLHQALEAKENVKVGEMTQTYATVTLQNYFRMYHKLAGMTGTAETEAGELWQIYKLDVVVIPTNKKIIRDDREDLVYKTSKEKFNAAIEEIINLSTNGRPVLVGTTSVEISEKLSRMLKMRNIDHNVLNAKQHQREAEVVAEAGKAGKVTIATNMAGRGTDIKLGSGVREAGGLAIIGTERHDSRRVDRQLRGRSGRQGDPGSSQFYVSLEDNLMRLFHSERIAKLMDRMGHKEGDVIQHSMVTKSIERAQKKVEENNFGIRKRLLEYDDVMNIQREAIYKKRKHALEGERLSVDIGQMFNSLTEAILSENKQNGDYDSFLTDSITKLGMDPDIDPAEFKEAGAEQLLEKFQKQVWENYYRKGQQIIDLVYPVVKRVHEQEGKRYKKIAVPYTDNQSRALNVGAEIEDGIRTKGKSIILDIEKTITLALIDDNWKEHLRNMDELKESVQAASFEQKDPLVIYKMEAYNLFEQLIYNINVDVVSYLMKGKLMVEGGEQQTVREAKEQKTDLSKTSTNREREEEARRKAAMEAGREGHKIETVVRTEKKVGRNDDCPCGSGKKYKHCHGRT